MGEQSENPIITEAQIKMDRKVFDEMTKSELLQRITLGQPLSKAVAREKKGQAGEFFFGMENECLGERFDCLVGPWRARAVRIVKEEVELESFDPASETFKQIQTAPDDRQKNIVNMFGLDFLLYVFDKRCWGTFFFAKTARRNAALAEALIGKAGTFFSEIVETKQYTWWTPKVAELTDSIDSTEMPSKESYLEAVRLFTGAQGTTAEAAPPPKEGARPR